MVLASDDGNVGEPAGGATKKEGVGECWNVRPWSDSGKATREMVTHIGIVSARKLDARTRLWFFNVPIVVPQICMARAKI